MRHALCTSSIASPASNVSVRLSLVDRIHSRSHSNKAPAASFVNSAQMCELCVLQLRGSLAPQVLGIMTDLTIQQPVTKTYTGSKIMAKSSASPRCLAMQCVRDATHHASTSGLHLQAHCAHRHCLLGRQQECSLQQHGLPRLCLFVAGATCVVANISRAPVTQRDVVYLPLLT